MKSLSICLALIVAAVALSVLAPPAEAHHGRVVLGARVVTPAVNVQVVNQRRGIFGRRSVQSVNVQAFR